MRHQPSRYLMTPMAKTPKAIADAPTAIEQRGGRATLAHNALASALLVLAASTPWLTCDASTAANADATVSPVKGILTDEPVVQGHCGRWVESGLSDRIMPMEGGLDPRSVFDGRLELLDGIQGCSVLPVRSGGAMRRASMPALEASNRLWFSWEDQAEAERTMSVEGEWTRDYTYSAGTGLLATMGVKAELVVDATVEVEIELNRRGPECSSGGCARGDGLAQASLELNGLVLLAPELQRFFDDRAIEEQRQEWYHLPDHPETLRRRVSLAHNWCRETAVHSWNFGVEFWPPGIELGSSGPDQSGNVVATHVKRRLDRRIKMCIRPPAVESGSASFSVKLLGKVEATTKIAAVHSSKTTSKVSTQRLRVRFEDGCVDCDPAGDPGIGHQGGSTGAG